MAAEVPDTAIVHLVWAPLGVGALEGFLAAYREHQPGAEHRLVLLCNGFDGGEDVRLSELRGVLGATGHELLLTPSPVLDLAAYRQAAQELRAARLCFVNSYSRPLVDGWLAKLLAPLGDAAVGVSGCGGSYESAYSAAPFWLKPQRRRDFPPFPNPHLRSNGFVIARELLLELDWPAPGSKPSAWALESGRRSFTRQLGDRGLAAVVVGRDGVAYPAERWRESATFRSGAQRNLLIADNRTRQYEEADAALRRRLEEMAWGAARASRSVPRRAGA